MKKCVGAIEEFEFLPLNSGKHLHVTIAVTGWLCSGKYSKYCFCCLATTNRLQFPVIRCGQLKNLSMHPSS